LRLSARLFLILCGVAAFSTGSILVHQERTLTRDLESAASDRLDRAGQATRQLLSSHLQSLGERYRAISGTPQFRAALEIDDLPTLRFFASDLVDREGAAVVAFFDSNGRLEASAGDTSLTEGRLASGLDESDLLDWSGRLYAVAQIPLRTGGKLLGHLVALEEITSAQLERWSALCGASVHLAVRGSTQRDRLERSVDSIGGLELRVGANLESEAAALRNSRLQLVIGATVALSIAIVASLFLARGVVRPIIEMKSAALRTLEGDFEARTASRRADEIGDVARAFDQMLSWLRGYRTQVEEQRRVLEEKVGALERSERELARAHEMAHIGSWYVDVATGEFFGAKEFRTLLGLDDGSGPLPIESILDSVHPEDRALVEQGLSLDPGHVTSHRIDFRIPTEDGYDRILHAQSRIAYDEAGAVLRIEGTVQDVTERKRSEEQIQFLAHHDNLTGLGNRFQCRERLELEIAQARRNDSILGVLFLDLDHFKLINDSFGHSIGDELLVEVANRLVAGVRESDLVSRSGLGSAVSRLGGDEFMVLLAGIRDAQDLARVARRVLEKLSEPFQLGGHQVVVGASIGLAAWPFDGEDVETLLQNADAAMYYAKDQGRNNYQFYTESMNEVALRRLMLENHLRRGLEHEEFSVAYQPKLSLRDGSISGYEALLRWNDPDTGPISPAVFIPIAEETGLIVPIGKWVLEEACRQLQSWKHEGRELLPVAVNLSIHQFRVGDVASTIMRILERHGISPSLIELEITESTLMRDERTVVAELEKLRDAGFHISIDDFGTGYSSLAHLRRLPVDSLKIDRSFITSIEHVPTDAALVRSIISMASALGLSVIAEGVETAGQQELLRSWECDHSQGFLFCRPLPAIELERDGKSPRLSVS